MKGQDILVRWDFVDAKHFSDYRALWNHLNACGPHTPLLDARFMELALNHFSKGREILAIAERGDEALGMALFKAQRFGSLSMFQPSQLPLGPLVIRGDASLTELVKALVKNLPLQYALGSLTQIDPHLYSPPNESECNARTLPYIETGFIDLPRTHAEYLGGRPKRKCSQIAKRIEKAEVALGLMRLTVDSDVHEVARLVEAYADMESAGWKARDGTALRRGGSQAKFYRAALEHFAELGQLKVFILYFGDRRAAMQLALSADGCLYLLKSSYDEALSHCSPGMALKHYVLEYLYRTGEPFHRVEFYGRVIEPHRVWITGTRKLFHVNVYRVPLLARLHDVMRATRAHARGASANPH